MRTRTVGTITLLLFIIVYTIHFPVSDTDRNRLALAVTFIAILTMLFYFLTDYILKRKRYVQRDN